METSAEITKGLGIRVEPGALLGEARRPDNLGLWTPAGNGVYGYQQSSLEGDPIARAPRQESSGGVVYFGGKVSEDDFYTLLSLLGCRLHFAHGLAGLDYSAYLLESSEPEQDNYLTQMRVVSKFAQRFMFGTLDEASYTKFEPQPVPAHVAMWKFMEFERGRWGTEMGSPALDGKFGGDGDYAIEKLSFGLARENDYNDVFRIWSRAWLVTK